MPGERGGRNTDHRLTDIFSYFILQTRGGGSLPKVTREDVSRSLASLDRWVASFTIAGDDDKERNEGSTSGGTLLTFKRKWETVSM